MCALFLARKCYRLRSEWVNTSLFMSSSHVVQKNSDSQFAFSGTLYFCFTPVSEQFVEKIILQTVPKTSVLDPMPAKLSSSVVT